MGILENYSQWPLSRQLQVVFIISCFLLTLVLVIITRIQLDWLRDKIIKDSTKVLEDNLISQMIKFGEFESKFMSNEFSNYIAHVRSLNHTDRIVLGYSDYKKSPFNRTIPVWHENVAENSLDYSQAVFYSRLGKTADVVDIMDKDSAIDKIYPNIYSEEYISLYQGFQVGEILHYYPGIMTEGTDYTPLVREWYYKAAGDIGNIIFTEPYIDITTGQWIITVSTAMLDNSDSPKFFGVAAADITLVSITSKISKIKILDTGFLMLVSSGGMILTMPESWKPSDSTLTLRIFDTTYTGISETQWNNIKNSVTGSEHNFNDINGTKIIMTKHDISPFSNSNNITHYLLVCAKKNESDSGRDSILTNFSKTYNTIFWAIFSIAVVVLLTVGVLIHLVSRKTTRQLKIIENIFGRIIRRALFPKMKMDSYFQKLDNCNSDGIVTFIQACKEKVRKIENLEMEYGSYKWGFTRPRDQLLYLQWTQRLYPNSEFSDKVVDWWDMMPNLEKVLTK
ncbi:hypothetical protein SteCoe_10417 [Stentor coeruleus]|uniref:Cache domain-containing protein n=1 Tax=Stentor coeruleus TaxID=5963 RepID=A0A1R2CFP2_9CILI|nr:hypothetical protein SteCoe_10417 [Stentor coeruleus]